MTTEVASKQARRHKPMKEGNFIMSKTTKTAATYPIVAALVAAEQMEGMGANRQWQASNELQLQFLEQFFKPCRREVDAIPEIESLASWDVEEINVFLMTARLHHPTATVWTS